MTIQPQDNDGIFRIVDCKYMYNLATSSLMGAGITKWLPPSTARSSMSELSS